MNENVERSGDRGLVIRDVIRPMTKRDIDELATGFLMNADLAGIPPVELFVGLKQAELLVERALKMLQERATAEAREVSGKSFEVLGHEVATYSATETEYPEEVQRIEAQAKKDVALAKATAEAEGRVKRTPKPLTIRVTLRK